MLGAVAARLFGDGFQPNRVLDHADQTEGDDTPDGTIWALDDSRLMPDHHLRMPHPDGLLFDFSNS